MKSCLTHQYPVRSLANTFWSVAGIDTTNKPVPKFADDGAKAITQGAVEQLAGEEQFFMFLNYMDAHAPFRNAIHYDSVSHPVSDKWHSDEIHKWEINKDDAGTEEYFRKYRALYGAAIEYLDMQVLSLVDTIEKKTDKETTVVITADHGHNIGYPSENGLIHHNGSVSEGLLHVPLEIVDPPDGYPDRIEQLFSHLSLATLLSKLASGQPWDTGLVDEEVPAETVGLSGTGDPRNYREFEPGEYEYWDRLMRCVYRDDQKVSWDSLGNRTRYRIELDRPCWQEEVDEVDSVRAIEQRHFETPGTEYKERATSERTENEMTDGVVTDRLRQLGYM